MLEFAVYALLFEWENCPRHRPARGIGRAIALKLSGAGASVMLNDIDREPLMETGSLIDSAGGAVKAMPGDLTSPEFPQKLVDATVSGFGSIDIIVNNAGYSWDNVIQKMTDEQFQAMLDIHLVAPFRVLRAASGWIREAAKRENAEGRPVMRKVVNISSVSGTNGNAGQTGYGAGKAGINGITKTLAKEWGRYNVTVNSVAFGSIDTRMLQPMHEIEQKGKQIRIGIQPEFRETLKSTCALGRLGTPEEAAGAVLFFCSPLSDYVSGEILTVSGGGRG